MLNALDIPEYIIKMHTKNEMSTIQKRISENWQMMPSVEIKKDLAEKVVFSLL